MADQVSPLGNLGTGSPIPALPAARAVAVQSGSTSVNTNSSSADPAVLAKPAAHPSAKPAEVNPQAINAQLQQANSSLQFKVDKSTGISYFKIVDSTTGKVIRQVPSEDVLAMAQKLQDFSSHQNSSGILMDQKG